MRPHVCTICGHVYDPATGRPGMGIPPGTPFTELSDGWCCPVCSAVKSRFRKA
jgi:rubredoxin